MKLDTPSTAFLGFRRGGSSVSFMIIQRLLIDSGLCCVDIVKDFHGVGINLSQIPVDALADAFATNHLVGCFREMPTSLRNMSLDGARTILVIRDPRDCQLSWFYGRYLHQGDALPASIKEGAAVHEDLSEQDSFERDVSELLQFARDRNALIIRYEDIVQNPLKFIVDCTKFAGWPVTRAAVDAANINASFIQAIVDETSHSRSGAPYSSLMQMPRQQLEQMNGRYGDLVEALGYPLWPEQLQIPDVADIASRDAMKRYVGGLAQQNGYRIEEIKQLKELAERQQSTIAELQEQNHFRILEIQRLAKSLQDLAK